MTLLVLVLRGTFHPSHEHLLGGFIGSPNLTIASRDGYRQSSRPHRCLPQGLRVISPWAAAWPTASLRIDS